MKFFQEITLNFLFSPYIFSIFIGYFIGSFPTAYLLVKRKNDVDIREAGSGNVGAMNAFEITNSKTVGVLVMIIDLVKGVAAVLVSLLVFGREPVILSITGFAAVVGHCYPVWLKFKGGRGLSTAGGVLLVLGWSYVVAWCLLFALIYFSSKNIHVPNIAASFLTPVVLAVLPEQILRMTLPSFMGTKEFLYFSIIISCFIVWRHRESLKDFWKLFRHSTT